MRFWRKAHACQMSIVECDIQDLSGRTFTVTVQLDWDVATLKQQIENVTSFPRYLQELSNDNDILLNGDKLREVFSAQSFVDSRFCLFLKYLEIPSGLTQTEVQRAGEAFRIHSTEYGDTIPRSNLVGLIRYVELDTRGDQVKTTLADMEWMSFANVLSVMATMKVASVSTASEEDVIAEEIAVERRTFASEDADDSREMIEHALHMVQCRGRQQARRNSAEGHATSQYACSHSASRKGTYGRRSASTSSPQFSLIRDNDVASLSISL
eukprot:TRINITY_DN48643_c0_g1_i1.p1 TRINITY_DN48643_c0_g1~~TRINITY_DN48643_c0_g1_i1.p1  ORF type:complete len:268 (+),score=30.93 TRINITY_DN48643_c0_g1_i1:54-857(+)